MEARLVLRGSFQTFFHTLRNWRVVILTIDVLTVAGKVMFVAELVSGDSVLEFSTDLEGLLVDKRIEAVSRRVDGDMIGWD